MDVQLEVQPEAACGLVLSQRREHTHQRLGGGDL